MPNIDQAANLADNLARLLDQIKNSSDSSPAAAAAPSVPSIAQPAFKTDSRSVSCGGADIVILLF